MGYKATSITHFLEELQRNGTITGWRTLGFSSNGRIVGEVSPKDFSRYGIDGFFEFSLSNSEPQVALGFRMACGSDNGWIGRAAHLGERSDVFCELRDNSLIETVRTKALNRLEQEFRQSLNLWSVRVVPTTLSQGRLFGSTHFNTEVPPIPWFVDVDGACRRLPTKGNRGATPLVVDKNGIVWGTQAYLGLNMSAGLLKQYQLCCWVPDSSGGYVHRSIDNLIDDDITLCWGVYPYGEEFLLLQHARIKDGQGQCGISIVDPDCLEEIRRYELPRGENLMAIFSYNAGDGLVYSSAVDGFRQTKMCWLSFTEHRNVPLTEKLGRVEGLAEESVEQLLIKDIAPDGRLLAVLLSSGNTEQIFVLEPI